MKRRVLLIAALLCTACFNERHGGPIEYEAGTVAALSYTPPNHGSGIGYTFTGRGGGPTVVSVSTPEEWAVVFRCQHGSFVVDGPKAKELFGRFKQGDAVEIQYRVIYETVKGQDVPVDMDFIDAKVTP